MNTILLSRREALGVLACAALSAGARATTSAPRFITRGVVLYPWDLSLADWPQRASKAGITTIALHAAQRLDILLDFLKSESGTTFLADCREYGVHIEYELHAMGTLLSRELYYSPGMEMFRLDESGKRNPDGNCCPSSPEALTRISEKAVEYGRLLRPTTGRYFHWPDDGGKWCHCPKCKGLNAADQAVLVENAMVEALRKHLDPAATLSHIAYGKTLLPPAMVKPHEALFLEFAPISRVYDRSIGDPEAMLGETADPPSHAAYLEILDANLEVFGKDTAQVLEYWLDVSRFSSWQRPAQKISWLEAIVRADADAYARRGIRHAATFATWIDADYVKRFGDPPLTEYVTALEGTYPGKEQNL